MKCGWPFWSLSVHYGLGQLPDRHTNRQVDSGRQADRLTYRQSDRQTDRHTDRQTGNQTDRQTDIQAGRQADREEGRQADRQTDGQTDRPVMEPVSVKSTLSWVI